MNRSEPRAVPSDKAQSMRRIAWPSRAFQRLSRAPCGMARRPFAPGAIGRAVAECVRNRATLSYTAATGLVFGSFLVYLATSQQIFQEQYGLGRLFPVAFGGLAVAVGVA